MSVVDPSFFLSIYDKFADEPPNVLQYYLDEAEKECPVETWQEDQLEGIMLLTAHYLELERIQQIQTAGNAASIAAGKGGSNPSSEQDDLKQTLYGRRYRRKRLTLGTIGILA